MWMSVRLRLWQQPQSHNNSVFECTGLKNRTGRNQTCCTAEKAVMPIYPLTEDSGNQHAKQWHDKLDFKARILLHLIKTTSHLCVFRSQKDRSGTITSDCFMSLAHKHSKSEDWNSGESWGQSEAEHSQNLDLYVTSNEESSGFWPLIGKFGQSVHMGCLGWLNTNCN